MIHFLLDEVKVHSQIQKQDLLFLIRILKNGKIALKLKMECLFEVKTNVAKKLLRFANFININFQYNFLLSPM